MTKGTVCHLLSFIGLFLRCKCAIFAIEFNPLSLFMKRITRCLPLIIPALGLVLTLMTGCAGKKENAVITVQDQHGKHFPIYDYFEVDKIIYVNADDKYLLSDISSVHINGNYIYTLDSNHKISKIDLNTGNIICQYCQIGRGPQDYLFPIGLTGDDEHLYTLDLMGKSVHKFSYDLKHQGKFSLEKMSATSSLFKTKDGFIFYNSFDSEGAGKFTVTDNKGEIKQTFINVKEEQLPATDAPVMKTIFTNQMFVPTPDGKLLCFDPDGNKAYLYDGTTMDLLLSINMDLNYEKIPQTPDPYVQQLYCINGNILVNYSYNTGNSFSYYDKDLNLIATGSPTAFGKQPKFNPICQTGDKLITASCTDDAPGAVLPDRSIQAAIIIHRAK